MAKGDVPKETREVGETPRPTSSDVRIETRRHAGGFSIEAFASGQQIGVLEAERRSPELSRTSRFSVDHGSASDIGRRMLDAARAEPGELEFRWRKEGTGSQEPGRVELLREGASADGFWRENGEAGPSEHFLAEDLEARGLLADHVAGQIGELTGEAPPDLRERARYLDDDAFDREVVEQGIPVDNPRNVLGLYEPGTREILVRDSDEARRQAVLLHEGLHAWREERAEQQIPSALNEALTQHFTEVADPSAGRTLRVEQLADGRLLLSIPNAEASSSRSLAVEGAPTVYEPGVRIAKALEARVGRETLLDYYRTGDPSVIRGALGEQRGRSAWAQVVEAMSRKEPDLATAERIVAGKPG